MQALRALGDRGAASGSLWRRAARSARIDSKGRGRPRMRGKRRGVRGPVDTGKLALLERFGAEMLSTARRYSQSPHDAEDAYQRAAEILLTHEPRGSDDELCRWLRTVTKHEALAIRRHRQPRHAGGRAERDLPETTAAQPETHERAERFEQLRLGAQALGRLKPQEVRCLLLKAEGYSYREICAGDGLDLHQGQPLPVGGPARVPRTAGRDRVGCRVRSACAPRSPPWPTGRPLPDDLAALRPHLRTCLGCRAAAARVSRGARPRWRRWFRRRCWRRPRPIPGPSAAMLEWAASTVQDRAAALGERAQHAAELAVGGRSPPWRPPRPRSQAVAPPRSSASASAPPGRELHPARRCAAPARTWPHRPPPSRSPSAPQPRRHPRPWRPRRRRPSPAPVPAPSPANEFTPEAAAAAAAPPVERAPAASEFGPGGGAGSAAASGGGEFGP